MKNRGMGIAHPKLRGEWVELNFMMRALELAAFEQALGRSRAV